MRYYTRHLVYKDRNSLGFKLRRKRANLLATTVTSLKNRLGRKLRIADFGGTERYWLAVPSVVLEKHIDSILLINKKGGKFSANNLFIRMNADVCRLDEFSENSFDLVHSNSTIEHVGGWRQMILFANEVRRLAPYHFVQTPNFWFPFEPHFGLPFFHWLPEQIRIRIALRYKLAYRERCKSVGEAMKCIQSARLLDEKQMQYLFPKSEIYSEKLAYLTKSLIAIKK